jgi:Putative zinc-finger
MPDRTKNDHTNNGMQCAEFDLLLSDALDGVLSGAGLDRFHAHARSCKTCGPLFEEAEAGRTWLQGLTEVEPPASLVPSILASTTGVDSQRLWAPTRAPQPQVSWWERLQASFLEPTWAVIRQPRFAMSFGMAFFALSVSLTTLGVKPSEILNLAEHPTTIKRTYYNTQARVVRYVDNVRPVLELQAALRTIKRNVNPAEPGPDKQKERKNDTTQQPEQKQERNYSQTGEKLILARAPLGPSVDPLDSDLPVVSVTTYRRFV